MKKILGLTLASALALTSAVAMAQDNDNKVFVNGKEIAVDYIVNDGNKLIPLRGVCEELGFEVNWIEESRTIEIAKMPVFITCSPDADGYSFAKMARQPLGIAPVLKDGTTYVPTNFVDEILQGTIDVADDIKITYGEATEDAEDAPIQAGAAASVYATEIGESSLTVMDFTYGEVIVNVSEQTVITDSEGNAIKLSDIDASMQLNVTYSDAMTMSIPAMTTAVKIEATNELAKTIVSGSVTEIIKDEVVSQLVIGENEVALNIAEDTVITNADGETKTFADIKEGNVIKARTNGKATRSIPAQMSALELIIVE